MDEQTKAKGISLEDLQISVQDVLNKGLGNIGTCSTAASTAAKEVTFGTIFDLVSGATILVTFTNGISVAGATLAVTHTPIGASEATTEAAKPIYYKGAALKANIVESGVSLVLRYNGTQFDIVGQVMNESGEYKDLTAGNIVGTFSDNNAQFGFRPTAGAVDISSGKADNGAKITNIKGNTVAWNQLLRISNIYSGTYNGVTITPDRTTGIISVTGKAELTQQFNLGDMQNDKMIVGHKYLLCGATSTSPNLRLGDQASVFDSGNGLIWTCQSNSFVRLAARIEKDFEYSGTFIPLLIDLTLLYGSGNEPSTVEAFEADYFKWFGKPLSYEAYDAGSLRPVNMSGIKTVGFNQWDEEWEKGGLSNETGEPTESDSNFRSKNYIPVFPNTQYYGFVPTGKYVVIHRYGKNKEWLGLYSASASTGNVFETTSDTYYIKFRTYLYSQPYNHDICINLAHSNARNGQYEAHWDSLCSIPITSIKGKLNGAGRSVKVFPDGLKRAGDVYDEIVKRGEQTIGIKRIGSVDLGTLTWNNQWWDNNGRLYSNLIGKATGIDNIIYPLGPTVNGQDSIINAIGICGNTSDAYIYIGDAKTHESASAFINSLSGVYAYYELAEPQEYVLDFTLPQVYDVDDYGTEEIVYPDGVQGTAPTLDIEYGINAPDTIKNLPRSYVSAIGEQEFNVGQKERARLNIGIDYSYARKTDFDLDDLHNAVAEGNLEKYGLKVGDEKTINGHTYVIAGLNPMKGTNTPYRVAENHVGLIVIPHTTAKWNASGNTYTGANNRGAGYLNCDLHYYLKNTVLPLVNTDLGSTNLIGHRKLLTCAVKTTGINRFGETTGCSSDWAWEANCNICALSEVQAYGSSIWSSSGYDTGEACRQLEVFQKYSHTEIFGGEYPWLRDVVSASYAAVAYENGNAYSSAASNARYVAALILFK